MPDAQKSVLSDLPMHHLLFLKVRDGGGPSVAHSIAELHEISVDAVKQACRIACEEQLRERGELQPYEVSVYNWARS